MDSQKLSSIFTCLVVEYGVSWSGGDSKGEEAVRHGVVGRWVADG
jgi:hypothetical protein